MLIKLTGVPHPELDDGVPRPVYIDPRKVIVVVRGHIEQPKLGSAAKRRALYTELFAATSALQQMISDYVPRMDDPVAVEWMLKAQATARAVNNAYDRWASAYKADEISHPPVACTEVHLSCGTALEQGVMLTRVFVSETPEEVVNAINWRDIPKPIHAGQPGEVRVL